MCNYFEYKFLLFSLKIFSISLVIIITLLKPTSTASNDPDPPNYEYPPDMSSIEAEDLEWYNWTAKGYLKHPEGDYFKYKGKFVKYNQTYTLINTTNTFKYIKDPKGDWFYENGNYFTTEGSNDTVTSKTVRTTTTLKPTTTLQYPGPEVFQNFYMRELVDNLPPIEMKVNCTFCPRVYIPVCGSDGRSYINTCRLICANIKKRLNRQAKIAYMGNCQTYMDPYQY